MGCIPRRSCVRDTAVRAYFFAIPYYLKKNLP